MSYLVNVCPTHTDMASGYGTIEEQTENGAATGTDTGTNTSAIDAMLDDEKRRAHKKHAMSGAAIAVIVAIVVVIIVVTTVRGSACLRGLLLTCVPV